MSSNEGNSFYSSDEYLPWQERVFRNTTMLYTETPGIRNTTLMIFDPDPSGRTMPLTPSRKLICEIKDFSFQTPPEDLFSLEEQLKYGLSVELRFVDIDTFGNETMRIIDLSYLTYEDEEEDGSDDEDFSDYDEYEYDYPYDEDGVDVQKLITMEIEPNGEKDYRYESISDPYFAENILRRLNEFIYADKEILYELDEFTRACLLCYKMYLETLLQASKIEESLAEIASDENLVVLHGAAPTYGADLHPVEMLSIYSRRHGETIIRKGKGIDVLAEQTLSISHKVNLEKITISYQLTTLDHRRISITQGGIPINTYIHRWDTPFDFEICEPNEELLNGLRIVIEDYDDGGKIVQTHELDLQSAKELEEEFHYFLNLVKLSTDRNIGVLILQQMIDRHGVKVMPGSIQKEDLQLGQIVTRLKDFGKRFGDLQKIIGLINDNKFILANLDRITDDSVYCMSIPVVNNLLIINDLLGWVSDDSDNDPEGGETVPG